jgi:hypothetical protein
MCTMIATKVKIAGSANAGRGWARVSEALVGYDHATQVWADHALRLDFVRADTESLAVEMDLASGRALLARLTEVIAAAERVG